MDRPKHNSFIRLADKNNFPFLKGSVIMNKALISISRVDLDSKIMKRQYGFLKTASKQLQHGRTYSGIQHKNQQKSNKSLSRNLIERSKLAFEKYDKFKSIPSNQMYQTQKEYHKQLETARTINIQKSKISSKNYGKIKSYAANSHPGSLNYLNQDRVCIVTNLNKTSHKTNQVSFFAIYDGHNGTGYSDYMRDAFHVFLIEDQMFWKDMQRAIRNTLKKVQKTFYQNPTYTKDYSSVNFVMVIIVGQICYYAHMGEPKAIISKKLGKQRNKFEQKQKQKEKNESNTINTKFKEKSTSVKNIKGRQTNLQNINYAAQQKNGKSITIKKLQLNDSVDFILLGSQGVFQAYKQNDLMRKAWTGIIQSNINNPFNNIHEITGLAVNYLMNQVIKGYSTKNISIILLTLNSIQEILTPDENIILPHHKNYQYQ